jgi:two-component system response regulator RegX3
MKILIIEDIEEMSELVSIYLKKAGMETVICETAEAGLIAIQKENFNLIILDINLPFMDGFQFLETMRHDFQLPVLILSARGTEDDMIKGLSLGADEYVTKPFSPRVLTARVEAILRRSNLEKSKDIEFGSLSLNIDSFTLKKDGERLSIPNRELEILILLIESSGSPISPEEIYKKIWGDSYGDITTVAVHIQRIRKKIETDPSNPEFIKTLHGKGYYFKQERNKYEH